MTLGMRWSLSGTTEAMGLCSTFLGLLGSITSSSLLSLPTCHPQDKEFRLTCHFILLQPATSSLPPILLCHCTRHHRKPWSSSGLPESRAGVGGGGGNLTWHSHDLWIVEAVWCNGEELGLGVALPGSESQRHHLPICDLIKVT